MSLPRGFRLGPYEILSPLRSGGMGDVYSATDKRLGRTVALKVLPEEVAQDARRLQRFEREARAASALNHPNIVTIHEFACSGSITYIVMEYVDGQTLRDELLRGPFPVRQLLDVAAQVTKGLAAAHAHGIVHRDLKPDNIMLARSGFVKILDFGLALTQPSAHDARSSHVEVVTETGPNVVMGTVQYMSPEQARAGHVDHRSDQFSLGVVLYEIATTRNPFRRTESSETITAIVSEQAPPLGELRPDLPAPLRWVVERCLSKDPSDRFDSTADLARDLESVRNNLHELTGTTSGGPAAHAWIQPRMLAWLAAGLIAVGLAIAYASTRRDQAVRPVLRFTVSPPPGCTFNFSSSEPAPVALSPDGRRLVFGARDGSGKSLLWVRTLSELVTRPLAGTEGATYPFWSPDSRSIAFFADRQLRRISADGGPVDSICETPQGRGGTWNRNGLIVFSPGEGPLSQVAASGGTPVALKATAGRSPTDGSLWPYFLPDGRHFLYLAPARGTSPARGIEVGFLDSSEGQPVLPEASNAAYAPPGYVLFVRAGNLLAARFDADRLRVVGEPVVVASSIHHHHYRLNADFSVSETGVLAYYGGDLANRSQLKWFDRQGQPLSEIGERAEYGGLRFSPDGSRCAVEIRDPRTSTIDIWLLDLNRRLMTRLTSGAGISDAPIWSPDGKQVLFTEKRDSVWDLYLRDSSAIGSEELAYASSFSKMPTDWSLDGRFIAFDEGSDDPRNVDIWVLSVADRSARPLVRTPFKESQARFSPDGHWIVYVSDETGRPEVYVQSFPVATIRTLVSIAGGSQPLWIRNGKEIFYVSGDDKLMSVPVLTSPRFEIGEAKPLFSLPLTPSASDNPRYAVSPDGQRVLVNTPGTSETPVVMVYVNWAAELKP